jgi:hypothetical protein
MLDVNIVLTETFPVQAFLEVSGTHMSGCGSIKKVRHQLGKEIVFEKSTKAIVHIGISSSVRGLLG